MPSTLPVTSAQIATLHSILQEADIEKAIFQELPPLLGGPVEVWVLDENSYGTQHRSVIIDEDGEVTSDMVVDD